MPETVVMKFGGTSVADPEKIRRVAARLVDAKRSGSRVVGVVSAMGHHTDELLDLAHDVVDGEAAQRRQQLVPLRLRRNEERHHELVEVEPRLADEVAQRTGAAEPPEPSHRKGAHARTVRRR